ncbi:uncharacterized protein BJ212DRAFT_942452 [Suillus subaureus]|uniref:Uncharacterized protein n=1 Tax=Suillus subaureus TaxID=48587 RepID=A0A9P7DET5_9AGAM|nr:uncharacterized protein BJ212DRAFT_942452 [Suillus subaureus]KAG1791284.1 hypothetical protein BJ212DRAFT_942452 [Suillus subaureus]
MTRRPHPHMWLLGSGVLFASQNVSRNTENFIDVFSAMLGVCCKGGLAVEYQSRTRLAHDFATEVTDWPQVLGGDRVQGDHACNGPVCTEVVCACCERGNLGTECTWILFKVPITSNSMRTVSR